MYTTYYDTVAYGAPTSTGTDVWGIIATILSVVGGVLLYFLFVAAKTEPKSKFAKKLKDFLSFKTMWIEPIMKVVYYGATIFTMLYSFSFFQYGGQGIIYFFLMFFMGPIIIRLVYEMFMMFIMIWRNTRDIAENTKKK